MKLLTVSLISLLIGLGLGFSALKTAEQIAKSLLVKQEAVFATN